MRELSALADARGITIVEDAAESFGSKYDGRASGTWGRLGSFSFQATKTVTTGEGAMVVTEDEDLRNLMALYRSHGMRDRRYWHYVAGHNFRLTNLQAAIGCAQLERFADICRERKRVHQTYKTELACIAGVTPQHFEGAVDPVLWAIAVRIDEGAFPQGRDQLIAQLLEQGIETRPGFYAASEMPLYETGSLPVCENIARNVISLPTYPTLTDETIAFICESLGRLQK
jgi:perosamine synthetase